ncbi:aminoglycoside phosphotransferase (APT) family kinase protein [Friedmanniella endophytica]|uniref:Aminoglycoside phosphotransferase (APT) family kinase protein n=1 Tax=Microlunatus kandeliicorticis TaxID=1759536 RepID=A0A7W3IS06_9ACTN|nr:aminoglycoside phosphotransferase family protein [Microlunatus kandeliicorticis]MBA8794095.1 aminoglycoside phosphotransferase (APT) family kinase protein [Microlunatus kandeliicorticis]
MTRTGDDAPDLTEDSAWREHAFFRRRPSDETLAWVAAAVGAGARVVGRRRLTGGVNSAVHRLTVERGRTRTVLVLRQYPAGSAALRTALETEIAHLTLVADSGLPVPTIVATDVSGAATGGAPSLLMTRLPGHVHLDPAERGPWIEEVARFAARIHAVDLPAPAFRPWTDSWITPLGRFRVPTGARNPSVWRAAFDALESQPPEDPAVFLHGDYLPVNLLWSRGRITGLTDWNSIHRGSRAVDVGQCRRYLASLWSPVWAEELKQRYEVAVGITLQPWWDLYALLHHDDRAPSAIARQVAGRRPVDATGMTARLEVVVERALRRLG